MADQTMNVVVLAGGESEEREVSLKGGEAVTRAINELPGFQAELLGPEFCDRPSSAVDVVFPVLHGSDGEDGRLQSRLVEMGLPFVGSHQSACQLTFDKHGCSEFLRSEDVLCPGEHLLLRDDFLDRRLEEIRGFMNHPPESGRWVVKPCCQGSSVGVSVIDSDVDLKVLSQAVNQALKFDNACLVQEYIAGSEVTVGLLDGTVLPAVEIMAADGFYDFAAKYESKDTQYRIVQHPAAKRAQQLAERINQLCGTSGIVRIDFRIDPNGWPWFLEVNTIPGMTDRSLVPMSAARLGWSMSELCQRAIRNAVAT